MSLTEQQQREVMAMLDANQQAIIDEAYRRGFAAAKAAAAQIVATERHIQNETGEPCDLSHVEDQIQALKPEASQ